MLLNSRLDMREFKQATRKERKDKRSNVESNGENNIENYISIAGIWRQNSKGGETMRVCQNKTRFFGTLNNFNYYHR